MSLTFGQTRYQALYKDVQCLIADTASIAVRKQPSLIYVYLPHTAVTGYGGRDRTIYLYFNASKPRRLRNEIKNAAITNKRPCISAFLFFSFES